MSQRLDRNQDHKFDTEMPPADIAILARASKPAQFRGRQFTAEQKIESRLHHLGDEIHEMVDAPYPGLLQDRGYVREALDELTSKHTTLLWTARVAKCTEGSVRERLWWDIDRALAGLEKIADSLVEH
jgi:hypothetical protein